MFVAAGSFLQLPEITLDSMARTISHVRDSLSHETNLRRRQAPHAVYCFLLDFGGGAGRREEKLPEDWVVD